MRRTLGLLIFLAACAGQQTPEQVLRGWYAALACGDSDGAWERLSEASQNALHEAASQWTAGMEGAWIPRSPAPEDADGEALLTAWILAGDRLPPLPADLAKLEIRTDIEGDRAQCTVTGPLGPVVVTLLLEADEWRIVLR